MTNRRTKNTKKSIHADQLEAANYRTARMIVQL